jgi:hypothetical protein
MTVMLFGTMVVSMGGLALVFTSLYILEVGLPKTKMGERILEHVHMMLFLVLAGR